MHTPAILRIALTSLFFSAAAASAQLTFDGDPSAGATGAQNGSGAWDLTTGNWWSGSANVVWNNDGATIAAFGAATTTTGGTITVSGTVNVGGMKFNALSGTPTTIAHTITGGIIDFADNAVIEMADNSSSGSSGVLFVNLNSVHTGNNLSIQRDPAAAASAQTFQYLRFGTANPDLTGTLTAKALNSSHGIFLLTSGANTVAGFTEIVIQNGSVLAAGGTSNTYANNISIAGVGTNSGAIRVDGAGIQFTGQIKLTADAAINTNTGISGANFSGGIVEEGGPFGFQRLAATQNSTLSLSGASTYTGATTIGRSGAVAAGVTTLDFAASTAPVSDILYHETSAGALNLWGGTTGGTFVTLQGKAGTANSQKFGAVTANGTRSNIVLTPGTSAGSMSLDLGIISRTTSASLAFVVPAGASVTTTTPDGFIGPWSSLADGAGGGSWAAASGGTLTNFTGNLTHETGTAINALFGYSTASHLSITNASTGDVQPGGAIVTMGTITMTDGVSVRTLDIGSGNTLRMGATGGIQITGGGKDLVVGVTGSAGSAGTLTGATAASQLWLTNMSSAGALIVNSVLANNTGALSVFANGSGNVVLAGNNTFTGAVQVGSGSLEARSSGALGTSAGGVSVLYGAALRLAGNITLADAMSVTGFGINNDGALRNLSGSNSITGVVTLLNPTRINSDNGTLNLTTAPATNILVAGAFALTLGGAGNITVDGRFTSTGTIAKDGVGQLTLGGDNTFTSALTLSAGTLRPTHANALGTTAGITTVSAGAALELTAGIALAAEPITLTSTGINTTGGIRSLSSGNTLTGLVTVNATARIQSDTGTLTFDAGSGNSIIKDTSASIRTLSFSGAGDIVVADPIAKSATVTAGLFNITKEGSGSLILRAANTYEGTTTANSGLVHLDFSAASSPASNILNSGSASPGGLTQAGGSVQLTGKSGAAVTQAFGGWSVSNMANFTVTQNSASSVNVTFAALTRAFGGILAIDLPTTGAIRTTSGSDNTILSSNGRVFAFIRDAAGGDEWAATGALSAGTRPIVKLSSVASYTDSTATTLSDNANAVATTTTLAAATAITSLRFALPQGVLITQDATPRTLTTGGILVASTVGANNLTIATGTLLPTAAIAATNPDLTIIQNNPLGSLTISSAIANRTETLNVVSLVKAGPGELILGGVNTFTGNVRVYDGSLRLSAGSISASVEFLLGSGTSSGKVILGSGAAKYDTQVEYFTTVGTGTDNRIVGGASVVSSLTVAPGSTPAAFAAGFLGGTGANENNLALRLSTTTGLLQLGPANTYAGKTSNLRGIMEISTLADVGLPSSLGTGNFDASAAIIDMGTQTTSAVGSFATATLRYIGSAHSTTNRPLNISNSDIATDITSVTAVIENTGTGTLKFTTAFTAAGSNPVGRTLRLEGTNTGANEIVGIGNASGAILTSLVKSGPGTWLITGNSTYSGGTTVTGGSLLVTNTGGSATGAGPVSVQTGATLGGTGRIALGANQSLTVTGGTLSVGNSTLLTPTAGTFELVTSGTGTISLDTASAFVFDLITRSGVAETPGVSDLAIISGRITIATGATLRVGNPTGIQNFAAGDQWQLFDWTGLTEPVTGTFSTVDLPALGGSLEWNLSRLYDDGILGISAVPEPSRALLLFCGLLTFAFRRRRAAC